MNEHANHRAETHRYDELEALRASLGLDVGAEYHVYLPDGECLRYARLTGLSASASASADGAPVPLALRLETTYGASATVPWGQVRWFERASDAAGGTLGARTARATDGV